MSRFDNVGLFWQDLPKAKGGRGDPNRPMPAIPETGWTAPTEFPDLSSAPVIALDVETYDPDLIERGPGWARGVGELVGVSLAVPDGHSWYFPMRHRVRPEENMDPAAVLAYLRDTLGGPQPKVGANITYDVGWLRQEGVRVGGTYVDVQFAEALLDESAKVALEILGQKYLKEGKETSLLYQWCADYYGGNPDHKQRANIYRAPPSLVGHYAEADADLPLRLAPILYKLLEQQGLMEVFAMECGLIPLLIDMRFAGVRVDVSRAEQLRDELVIRESREQERIDHIAGQHVDINSNASLAQAFDRIGLSYGKTAKGAPSFTKQVLEGLDHPLANHIKEKRKLEKLRSTFLESYILDSHVDGMVYGQFHLLRNDEGGTRSGRLSSSNPNLQNIPSRDPELAPMVRGMYVPDLSHYQWRKYDYSQIEYRFLVHYAVGEGAVEVRQQFCNDLSTDYHDVVLDKIAPEAGWDISTPEKRKHWRRPTKNINFGLIFGMGVDKLSQDLGLTKKQGEALFAAYHRGAPFAKATMDQCSEFAAQHGYITTVLGRRSRFDLWEPRRKGGGTAMPYEKALLLYGGNIRRAFTHKALNRRLQGSAADLMKKAMLQCYNDGVFDEIGVPRLTVHDELNFSDPGGVDKGFEEMQHIMENAIPLNLPVLADGECGPDWGHVK